MSSAFGDYLSRECHRAKKSRVELAKCLGVSTGYISDVMRGNRPPLTPDRVRVAAEFLGGDVHEYARRAAVERGRVDLSLGGHSDTAIEAAVLLAVRWQRLSDYDCEHIIRCVLCADERMRREGKA